MVAHAISSKLRRGRVAGVCLKLLVHRQSTRHCPSTNCPSSRHGPPTCIVRAGYGGGNWLAALASARLICKSREANTTIHVYVRTLGIPSAKSRAGESRPFCLTCIEAGKVKFEQKTVGLQESVRGAASAYRTNPHRTV